MTRIGTVGLVATLVLGSGCTMGSEDNSEVQVTPSAAPEATTPTQIPEEAVIYAAVIREAVTGSTYRRAFRTIYVIEGPVKRAASPMTGFDGWRSDQPWTGAVRSGIRHEAGDLGLDLRFVSDGEAVVARRNGTGCPRTRREQPLVVLGELRRTEDDRAEVGTATWITCLNGQWMTYVVQERDGRWKVTGTTGPLAIS